MQIPYRKPGFFSQIKPDPLMTEEKFLELNKNLEHLKKIRPTAAAEVARLAELGDFSENAEYQMAKGRLRGINSRITGLEYEIKNAQIIKKSDSGKVGLGSKVKVEIEGKEKEYTILGSSETNPAHGVISHLSPLGKILMNKKTGDTFSLTVQNYEKIGKITEIS